MVNFGKRSLSLKKRGEVLMSDLLNTIGNVGFPIAVSVYLLVRLETKLEVLTQSINNLSSAIKNS
jgi:hypothetical protein